MVLKLYGILFSPHVRLVAAVLHEKSVPFELVSVDLRGGEHKTPEYLAKHPFGQIPYIDDDGFILYESKAICHYIASKYANQGTKLLPTELQASALYEQAVFTEMNHFSQHAVPARREIYGARTRSVAPDQALVDKHLADLSAKLDVYDKILSKQKYIAGDELTLADLFHLPNSGGFDNLIVNVIVSKPNVARWYNEISSRDSWVSTNPEVKPAA